MRKASKAWARVRAFVLAQHGWFWLGLILAVGAAVRLHDLAGMPPGLNQDEASTAYDAFSILHYGMDRNGIRFPLVLISWGSGMNALSAYIALPSLALLGNTIEGVRAGHAALHLTALVTFPLLGYLLHGKRFALLCAFLAAVSPWHIMISRWALDENAFPPVFLLGVLLQVAACRRQRFLLPAFVVFGLSLYAHGASYFTVPFYVGISTAYMLWFRKISWRWLLACSAVLFLLALPHLLYLAVNHFHWSSIETPLFTIPRLTGVPRYETVSSVFGGEFFASLMPHLRGLVDFFLYQGNSTVFDKVPGYGLTYSYGWVFLALGAVASLPTLFSRRFRPEALMMLWLLAALSLALVAPPNVNRMNIVLFPSLYFIAVCIAHFRSRLMAAGAVLLFSLSFVSFARTYFGTYQDSIIYSLHSSFDEAIALAADNSKGTVCVTTDGMNMPYIYVLFHRGVDTRMFLDTVVYENPGAEYQDVRSFGRYVFGMQHCPVDRATAIILRIHEQFPEGVTAEHNWNFTRSAHFAVAFR